MRVKVQEPKPPVINQQCVVYNFVCDLCDADYVGYTSRDLTSNFTILKKCQGKFDCLIFEMLWIRNKKPSLNTQSDSIGAKLFDCLTQ